jgi:hypothetical protein
MKRATVEWYTELEAVVKSFGRPAGGSDVQLRLDCTLHGTGTSTSRLVDTKHELQKRDEPRWDGTSSNVDITGYLRETKHELQKLQDNVYFFTTTYLQYDLRQERVLTFSQSGEAELFEERPLYHLMNS